MTALRLSAGIPSDAGHAGNRTAAAAEERAENAASSRERRMECLLRLASATLKLIAESKEAHMSTKSGFDLGAIWCGLMHKSVMWPIHGQYRCRTCGRHYPALANEAADETHAAPPKRPLFRPALPLLAAVLAAALAHPLRAAQNPEAAAALSQYFSGSGTARWTAETIEIDAALPKLGKTGRLEAIRRLLPLGQMKYQVLEATGDSTVKEQVIVRYLKAEQRAAEISPDSVAIAPANYKFAYKGLGIFMNRAAYVFQITPRKKRDGLIKGELWLDAGTALPLRESGYFVKVPSFFVKRVEVTQETVLQDSTVALRLTHLSVNTRLVGRAELVIEERPLDSAESIEAAGSGQAGE